jgi:hypothetical protein
MPRSSRACRAVGNATKGPSSVRWVTFAVIAAHISRADNVLRNDKTLRANVPKVSAVVTSPTSALPCVVSGSILPVGKAVS